MCLCPTTERINPGFMQQISPTLWSTLTITATPVPKFASFSTSTRRRDSTLARAGQQPDKTTFLTREDLGVDTFAGLEVQRSRETFTIYRETVGNTKTILRTVDYWYSPALGVNVQVKRHDPRDGDQTLWLDERIADSL